MKTKKKIHVENYFRFREISTNLIALYVKDLRTSFLYSKSLK